MASDQLQLQGLVDIEPPPPPPSGPAIGPIAIGIPLVLAVALLWVQRHSARTRALRELRQLRRLHTGRKIAQRDTAFRLTAILRLGLSTSRILPDRLPPGCSINSHDRWKNFAEELRHARFSQASATARELDTLIAEAKHWLRKHP
jgi:hypothetical protein